MRKIIKRKFKEYKKSAKRLINNFFWQKLGKLFLKSEKLPPMGAYNSLNDFKLNCKYDYQIKIVYESKSINFMPINTLQNELHKNFQETSFVYPEDYILQIPEARVYGENGHIITADHKVLDGVNLLHCHVGNINEQEIFSRLIMPELKHLKGNVAVMTTFFAGFYYHWMLDILPKFKMLDEAGFIPDYYIINHENKTFQIDTLQKLNIPIEKIIQTNSNMYITADNVIIPSMPGFTSYDPKWAVDFVKNLYLNPNFISKKTKKKIYLSRNKAFSRRFVNDKEICILLENYGFEEVILEDLTIQEQAQAFYDADIIFSPHGGGLTNLIFAKEGVKLIEVFSPSMPIPCYRILASMKKVEYYYVMADCPNNTFKREGVKYSSQDIIADIKIIEDTIKFALKTY